MYNICSSSLSIFTAFSLLFLTWEQKRKIDSWASESKGHREDRLVTRLLSLYLDWAVPLLAISFGWGAIELDFSVCSVGGSNLGSHRGIGEGAVYVHGGWVNLILPGRDYTAFTQTVCKVNSYLSGDSKCEKIYLKHEQANQKKSIFRNGRTWVLIDQTCIRF